VELKMEDEGWKIKGRKRRGRVGMGHGDMGRCRT
jgi:hypothetical protein